MQPEVTCPSAHLSETCCWHEFKNEHTKMCFCIFNSHFFSFFGNETGLNVNGGQGSGLQHNEVKQ